jgi:hypothetical protein
VVSNPLRFVLADVFSEAGRRPRPTIRPKKRDLPRRKFKFHLRTILREHEKRIEWHVPFRGEAFDQIGPAILQ